MGFRAAVASVFLLLGSRLMAQAPLAASALRGTVLDPQNRTVAGANVTLTEKAKGLSRQSQSDDSGSFLFPSIEPGAYAVRVVKDGFSPYEADDLTIAVGQLAVLLIRLRVDDIFSVTTGLCVDSDRDRVQCSRQRRGRPEGGNPAVGRSQFSATWVACGRGCRDQSVQQQCQREYWPTRADGSPSGDTPLLSQLLFGWHPDSRVAGR